MLICSLAPPYLTDLRDHSDPSNDESTDITTRTSTLYTNIHAIWLVSPQRGIVLSKKLRQRWHRSFGQDQRVFKWNRCGNQAADFIAGSVAKYASSGV